jgi:hypothetical protein
MPWLHGEGSWWPLDWKTSNGLYPEYALQVAANAKAMEQMSSKRVREAWMVRLGKTAPEFAVRKVLDVEGCFQALLAALHFGGLC